MDSFTVNQKGLWREVTQAFCQERLSKIMSYLNHKIPRPSKVSNLTLLNVNSISV